MLKHELAVQTLRETGYSLDEIEEILSSAIGICLRTLSTGEAIKISDFGSFTPPSGRLVFHRFLTSKRIVKGEVEAPKEPEVLYKVRRSRVKNSFKEQVAYPAPRVIEVRKGEREEVDYSGLVE